MITRIAKYSLKNILRNKFLSISSILVLTLLIFFINILFVVHEVSALLINGINSKLTISLYLEDDYDRSSTAVIELLNDIRDIDGESGAINITYKTKEEILDEIRITEPDLASIVERTNPLPETIVLSNIGLGQFKELNNVIENKLFILSKDKSDKGHFSNYTTQYKKIDQIISTLNMLELGLYVIIVIFLVSISIIIYSIISNFIYYYRDEIYVTRLVGGSKKFIYGPFVFQGGIYSFVSFILSMLIFTLLIKNITSVFGDTYNLYIPTTLLFVEMIILVFIGGISGFVSTKKYLK